MPEDTNIQINVSAQAVEKCRYCPDVPPGNYCDECGNKKPKKRSRSPLADQSPVNPDEAERVIREMLRARRLAEQEQRFRTQPSPPWPSQPLRYDPPPEVEEVDFGNISVPPFYTTNTGQRVGTPTTSPTTGPTYPFMPTNEAEPPF